MQALATPPLIAEFLGHPRESAWDRAYADAKNSVEAARDVTILDVTKTRVDPLEHADARVGVLFHVLRAREAGYKGSRARVEQVCQRQIDDGQLALGLAPFGDRADDAAEDVYAHVGDPPDGMTRWIEGAGDLEALRALLTSWLLTFVDLRMPSATRTRTSETVLSEEMPATAAGASRSKTRRLRGAI